MKKEDYKKLYSYYKKESELNEISLEKWKQLVKKNKDYAERLENILKKYKDIENELGINLDILLKSFGGVFYIKNNKIKFSCHLALVDWRFYVLDEGPISAKKGFTLELIDYGRKWSLYKKDLFVLPSDEPTYLNYPRDNKGKFIKRS